MPKQTLTTLAKNLAFLVTLLLALPAQALDYDVEIIIFERTTAPEGQEQWPLDSNQHQIHLTELQSTASKAVNYPTISGTNRLNNIETKLRNAGHRILKSAHWQQPGRVYQNAETINLSIPNTRFTGFLKIYKTSLIFADLNLALGDSIEEPQIPRYFLTEKRRLKFKEVHYFDHPRFGAILTVWPE